MPPEPNITLTLITPEDLDLTLALEGSREVMRFLGGPRDHENIVRIHQRRIDLHALGEASMYKITVDGQPAGNVGIWQTEHEGHTVHEMGWLLLPEFHGRGIATVAAQRLLDQARANPDIRAVHAFPGVDNAASNRICEKLGFTLLGEIAIDFAGRPLHCNNWRTVLR